MRYSRRETRPGIALNVSDHFVDISRRGAGARERGPRGRGPTPWPGPQRERAGAQAAARRVVRGRWPEGYSPGRERRLRPSVLRFATLNTNRKKNRLRERPAAPGGGGQCACAAPLLPEGRYCACAGRNSRESAAAVARGGGGGGSALGPFLCLQIAIRACFLGFAFGCGLLLSTGRSAWRHFGWYMCSLSLFHYSEYLVTAINNPRSLSLDSFLLNHSFEYNLAALSSWVEFTLEKLLFPELKQITWLSTVGLLMVIFGDCLRKAAMLTAGSNFNHIVQNEKSDTHTLVTSGVYGWFRHPSYVGWFYWSIGTQVLLCNPICMVGYALVSWRFFRERIEEEEITLIHFFGEEYLEYKRKVPSGLPFIRGVRVEL
ncbi:PREDICTED: protein-S-isoprenylcysteine O-methyltransferase [Haliaeetus leucocephalus]|uniref:protein-S-isoprenylcysteine O-methyltransferase n=1 Tax=Haliaeetus leucocephalus TaxID=52644 RepID=UPI00053CBFFC|nr:PREDICTED: protein-S-isoprenylcysteine O-methyltransferase [Haliaeetus leucocephalus]